MLNKQWHSLVIGLFDLTGSLLLIGSIMLESAFWRDIDGFVIGLIIMAIVTLFLFYISMAPAGQEAVASCTAASCDCTKKKQ